MVILVSAISVVAKARRKSKISESSKARKDARQDLYRPPWLLLSGWRMEGETVTVWRRPACAAGRGMAARVPETQDEADGMRDASEGEFSEALRRSLQAKLSTACPHALLSKCNASIFRRRSGANLRTANRSSQLDVAREERRGRRSWLQKRQGLLDERAVSLGCVCRERRRERALCRCNAYRFGSCRCS